MKPHVQAILDPCGSGAFPQTINHTIVDLDCDDLVGDFKQLEREIPGAGPDFQHCIIRFYVGNSDDRVQHSGVSQKMLPSALKQPYSPFFSAAAAVIFRLVFPADVAVSMARPRLNAAFEKIPEKSGIKQIFGESSPRTDHSEELISLQKNEVKNQWREMKFDRLLVGFDN